MASKDENAAIKQKNYKIGSEIQLNVNGAIEETVDHRDVASSLFYN